MDFHPRNQVFKTTQFLGMCLWMNLHSEVARGLYQFTLPFKGHSMSIYELLLSFLKLKCGWYMDWSFPFDHCF